MMSFFLDECCVTYDVMYKLNHVVFVVCCYSEEREQENNVITMMILTSYTEYPDG